MSRGLPKAVSAPLHANVKSKGVPVKYWDRGVEIESEARAQLTKISTLPIIHSHVAVMPDAHLGKGATVGAVIPCLKAIIPAAVGVDIGCGMIAIKTSLTAKNLPDSLKEIRSLVEEAVPHGRTAGGDPKKDSGSWRTKTPNRVHAAFQTTLEKGFKAIVGRAPETSSRFTANQAVNQLGTLGSGNHFIELCLDESDAVWCMLHSGSRGIGNRIGEYYIAQAKKDMGHLLGSLPDQDLAYLREGTPHFDAYVEAVQWAQGYAKLNRQLMMEAFVGALQMKLGPFTSDLLAVNCHHNYVNRERHLGSGEDVWVTRKGAVSAREGEYGIIPGSMGASSFIVRGLGNADSFHSCSHGAGRRMSRSQAKKHFTLADHIAATAGVECRKDEDVIDETPSAYKSIDSVIAAQSDLVEVVHRLRQVMCVKG